MNFKLVCRLFNMGPSVLRLRRQPRFLYFLHECYFLFDSFFIMKFRARDYCCEVEQYQKIGMRKDEKKKHLSVPRRQRLPVTGGPQTFRACDPVRGVSPPDVPTPAPLHCHRRQQTRARSFLCQVRYSHRPAGLWTFHVIFLLSDFSLSPSQSLSLSLHLQFVCVCLKVVRNLHKHFVKNASEACLGEALPSLVLCGTYEQTHESSYLKVCMHASTVKHLHLINTQ